MMTYLLDEGQDLPDGVASSPLRVCRLRLRVLVIVVALVKGVQNLGNIRCVNITIIAGLTEKVLNFFVQCFGRCRSYSANEVFGGGVNCVLHTPDEPIQSELRPWLNNR